MPTRLLLAAILLAAPAAAQPVASSGMVKQPIFVPFRGIEWRLVRIGDQAVASPQRPITLLLSDDNRATGSTGCNSYQAAFRVLAGRISFPAPPIATQIGCEPEAAAAERAYLTRLALGGRAEVRNLRTLRIRASGQPDLLYEKAETTAR